MKKFVMTLFLWFPTILLSQDNPITCEVIVMPNVFTPNNDNENDLFIPITYDYIPNSVLKIYNRWGVEVYYSQAIEKGWNGKHFSKKCPEGVYFWVVEFQTNTGNHKNISGSVNLLR
ncbi:MAG: gliding motility-associated C-terminal domain-containing protein [Flavobacteriales bacterium]|nr:gliding motility-associated C-terminal domain-containing protein [Flavobacteriales bacterium]